MNLEAGDGGGYRRASPQSECGRKREVLMGISGPCVGGGGGRGCRVQLVSGGKAADVVSVPSGNGLRIISVVFICMIWILFLRSCIVEVSTEAVGLEHPVGRMVLNSLRVLARFCCLR